MQSRGAFARAAGRMAFAAVLVHAGTAAAAGLSHFPDPVFYDGMENTADGPLNAADAARFLAQATFGPTDADIAHLRAVGYNAWLDEQFAAAPTSQMAYYDWVSKTLNEGTGVVTFREGWLLAALGGPDPQNNLLIHRDQLRQRVAFALSEIFVVSDQNSTLSPNANALAYFYDILGNNAFGSYRTLLEQVTLSPAMGAYLNMLGNPRPDLSQNQHPDENYAREINQLFSVGLVMLNPDGSAQTSQGQPIPSYNQAVVTAFAHVFTGWDWPLSTSFGDHYPSEGDFVAPMKAFAGSHDNGTHLDDLVAKQLLSYPGAQNGGALPSGGTPQGDLAFALDNIFNHPNVGPFIGRQLIQRLVTSNPSAQYVQRVTAAFNDDGSAQHVRGNLKAVVKAILLDPEARYGQFRNPTTFGKLREPVIRMTHFWRAMGAVHKCGLNTVSGSSTYHYANQPYRYAGYVTGWNLDDAVWGSGVAQAPLDALSVFNFFKPDFRPPGELVTAGLHAPEFQISTDSVFVSQTNNTIDKAVLYDVADACDPTDDTGDIVVNRAQDNALAGSANGGVADPADRLVDAYNIRFMSGQMSPFMRQTLLNYLNPIGQANAGADWKFDRIWRALLLIQTSPEYVIQK